MWLCSLKDALLATPRRLVLTCRAPRWMQSPSAILRSLREAGGCGRGSKVPVLQPRRELSRRRGFRKRHTHTHTQGGKGTTCLPVVCERRLGCGRGRTLPQRCCNRGRIWLLRQPRRGHVNHEVLTPLEVLLSLLRRHSHGAALRPKGLHPPAHIRMEAETVNVWITTLMRRALRTRSASPLRPTRNTSSHVCAILPHC